MIEILFALFIIAFALALSWGVTIGIIYLICLCFSWEFSLVGATGIWLIGCLIYWFIPKGGK